MDGEKLEPATGRRRRMKTWRAIALATKGLGKKEC